MTKHERLIKYLGSLLEEALLHLEDCDAWQLRESITKALTEIKTVAPKPKRHS